MKQIVILEETLDFLAWKGDRDDVFFAQDQATGDFRRVELVRTLPDAALGWKKSTTSDPVRIVRCRLLPPPCRQSKAEWESSVHEPWEVEYYNRHRDVLVLTFTRAQEETGEPVPENANSACLVSSEDDEPLMMRLGACKEDWRASFEREKIAVSQIEDDSERGEAKRILYWRYRAPFHVLGGEPFCGHLNLTLELVKQGGEMTPDGRSLRDAYLLDWWAKNYDFDLQEMARSRSEFFQWLKSHAESGETLSESLRREDDARFLLCAARVSYRCDFEDGSSAYLQEFKFSTPQLSEIQQLANLLEGAHSRGRESEHEPAKTPSKELSKKRAAAGHKAAKVRLEVDRKKIKAAFLVRVNGGLSNSSAARDVAALAGEDENTLELVDGPYYLSPDTIKRIAGVRKNK